jgi:hypothetical protein
MARNATFALAVMAAGLVVSTAIADGFSFGFSYGGGSCYRPAYVVRDCAPVVYAAPRVVYGDYCGPRYTYVRPAYSYCGPRYVRSYYGSYGSCGPRYYYSSRRVRCW